MSKMNEEFTKKVEEISNKFKIPEEHTQCYFVNFETEYFCDGCRNKMICERIKENGY